MERNTVVVPRQFPENVELAVNKMSPGTNDVEFVVRKVGRVFIDKGLDQIEMGIQGVTDLHPDLRRQGGKFFWRGECVGNHLEALVHEEHQRPVQLEEQFEFVWREQHLESTILRRFSITLIVR